MGRCRGKMCFAAMLAVIEAAPTAVSPRIAACRPRWLSATARAVAITIHMRERLAALEIQVIGPSNVGVGVLATAL